MSTRRRPSLATPLIDALPASVPFVGPEAVERRRGRPFAARLGANEHGFGPSPKVVDALRAAAEDVWMYGDPEGWDLRSALAEHVGARAENIALGSGIDGLLGLCCRLTLEPGGVAVMPLGGYPTFAYHAAGYGARIERVPYRQDHTAQDRPDLAAMAAQADRTGARLLYLANPDNPMGGYWDAAAIADLIAATPEDRLILLDEAYLETAPPGAAPPLDLARPNLLRLRTFSKAYGLAGLRVGYAIGAAETIAAFDKIRDHFSMGRLAQAGALAALEDQEGLAQSLRRIAGSRDRLAEIAASNGLRPLPSATNFVAMDCGGDGAVARALCAALERRDVFTRVPGAAPLDRCLRVSCGPAAQMELFAEALPGALSDARRECAPAS